MKPRFPKARLTKLIIEELSGVDRPCHAPAVVAIMKRDALKPKVCADCGEPMDEDVDKCADCGGYAAKRAIAKAVLSTADKDDLPDGSFLYIEGGGKKDEDGKTTPRSLRHFPYKDSAGKIDIVHLRAACSDIPKSSLPASMRDKLQAKAEKLLGAQHKVGKRMAVLTSLVDGHQHTIDPADAATTWCSPSTSYQTSEGADSSHCHAWVFDPKTGAIDIAADSGHTHTVGVVVPDAVLAAAAAINAEEMARLAGVPEMLADAPSDGIPVAVPVEESSGAVQVTIIQAREAVGKSTPPKSTPTVKPQPEPTMKTEAQQIVDLEAQLVVAKQHATLTDAARAHLATLTGGDAVAFLAKTALERAAIVEPIEVAKRAADVAANEVVYTSKSDGTIFRKRDDERLVSMAKRADAAEAKEQQVSLEKRATEEIGALGKSLPIRARILKALRAEFTVDAEHTEALEVLKGASVAMAELGKVKGASVGGVEATDPEEIWDAQVTEYAKKNEIKDLGLAAEKFLGTAEGRVAKRAYDETRGYALRAAK